SRQERADLRQHFLIYGKAWYEQYIAAHTSLCEEVRSSGRGCPDYVRRFWIIHLAEAEEWIQIQTVLTSTEDLGRGSFQPWAEVRLTAEGSYASYLTDLERLWSHAEQYGDLILSVRCALIVASIHSLSSNLAPELLVGLTTVGTQEGKWNLE